MSPRLHFTAKRSAYKLQLTEALCADMIITQRISTEWSNKSRGHPESVERNRVPRALKIPQPELNASHLVHEIVADEKSNFVLSEKIQTIDSLADYWTLTYETLSDSVQVLFNYNYWEHGKPERISFRRPIFRLKKGHIGVFWINGRITNSEGAQYYLSLIHISEPTRPRLISYAVFCLKKKKK